MTDPKDAGDFVRNAYRVCIYNTFQHFKKHIRYQIIKTDPKGKNIGQFSEEILGILGKLFKMMDRIDETKLRFEGYFMVNSETELLDSCADLTNLFRNYEYVCCDFLTIKNTYKRLIKDLSSVIKSFCNQEVETCPRQEMFVLVSYWHLVTGLFSLSEIKNSFLEKNWGYYLPSVLSH